VLASGPARGVNALLLEEPGFIAQLLLHQYDQLYGDCVKLSSNSLLNKYQNYSICLIISSLLDLDTGGDKLINVLEKYLYFYIPK